MRLAQPLLVAAAVFSLTLATGADGRTRAECERDYKPQVGHAGKDVGWVPTPDELVNRMLTMAKVTPKDYVVDLGAGDGKIAIAAGKKFGATALGIEYNPDMAKLAQCYVQAEGVTDKVKIIQGDIFKEDFSKATVVTMYLLPELNLCVRHRILAMAPGTRVTSHAFTMGEWEADESFDIEYRNAYLWIVPARVGGVWSFRNGSVDFSVSLNQSFQKIGGEVTVGGAKQPLIGAVLQGDSIRFAFTDAKGVTQHFAGKVRGTTIVGTLRASGVADVEIAGNAQGPLAAAPWAEMAGNCGRFYGK
jgi:phospholipid N-methyltransferase